MNKKIRFTKEAREDLNKAAKYYNNRKLGL